NYHLDTSSVPDDKITRKIRELRSLRSGFNIDVAVNYKMNEDKDNNKMSDQSLASLKEQFTNGKGKRWLENAVIWIYRRKFSYHELKRIVKFYKTSAGQKWADGFPSIVLTSIMAYETIHKELMKEIK
ncbi:MAG TPA: DUF2059 domain-containing protein, partial [Flavisolibacter sp.]|nr:DUF2059 domain-containing protein [Flavisolibacter sp.]